MRPLVTIFQTIAYYASFALFAFLSFALNGYALALSWLPATPAIERYFQRRVHGNFALFVRWLLASRIVPVSYEGFERWPRRGGLVVVSNHPSLMDIGFLLARIPEAVCIFKSAVGRNPLFNATARRAGYIASDGGHHILRDAAAKIASGYTLVIFPEGTRTRNGSLNPLKPGFVSIARMAHAPIQLVRITCDSELLTKLGPPWWHRPRLPARITVSLGPCLAPPGSDSKAVIDEIESWYRAQSEPLRPGVAPVALASVHAEA